MVDDKNLGSVRDYLVRNKERIIDDYNAEGVGIGKMDLKNDEYVIVVYLSDRQSAPEKPVKIDGILFKFELTGKFVIHT